VADKFKDQLCPQPDLPAVAGKISAPSPSPAAVPLVDKESHHKTEAEPVDKTIASVGHKRAAPTSGYCGKQGHRNAVRGGKFLCPKHCAESKSDSE